MVREALSGKGATFSKKRSTPADTMGEIIQAKRKWLFAEGSVIVLLRFYASARNVCGIFGANVELVTLIINRKV
jgi:hypothetical protein